MRKKEKRWLLQKKNQCVADGTTVKSRARRKDARKPLEKAALLMGRSRPRLCVTKYFIAYISASLLHAIRTQQRWHLAINILWYTDATHWLLTTALYPYRQSLAFPSFATTSSYRLWQNSPLLLRARGGSATVRTPSRNSPHGISGASVESTCCRWLRHVRFSSEIVCWRCSRSQQFTATQFWWTFVNYRKNPFVLPNAML